MAPGSLPHAQSTAPFVHRWAGPPIPAARAGCMAAAATTNNDAKTNFFIRPSDMQKPLVRGLFSRATKLRRFLSGFMTIRSGPRVLIPLGDG
jgi:hypothetical protein